MGYSDFTAFQLAALTHAGMTTFAGPMAAFDFGAVTPSAFTLDHCWKVLGSDRCEIECALEGPDFTGEGVLWGSNLAMIAHLVGTPHLPRIDGGINLQYWFFYPFNDGANLLPSPPNTEIWISLYAQVHQADKSTMRNIQLDLRRGRLPERKHSRMRLAEQLAEVSWSDDALQNLLAGLGLDSHSPLSVLAIELLPEPNGGFQDPLGGDLGEVRILRTSPLAPVQTSCCT
jgi:hypothetical protein